MPYGWRSENNLVLFPGIKLRSPGFHGKCLNCLSHLEQKALDVFLLQINTSLTRKQRGKEHKCLLPLLVQTEPSQACWFYLPLIYLVGMCVNAHASLHVWRSEDSMLELVLLLCGFQESTLVNMLFGKCFSLAPENYRSLYKQNPHSH